MLCPMRRLWRYRGTVLVTALFVVLILHALVVVTLGSAKLDRELLKKSDRSIEASLKARSAALYALDTLEASDGQIWESAHLISKDEPTQVPPANAEALSMTLTDGTALEVRAWVQETDDPKLRKVWGACYDGGKWHTKTAIAVKRLHNPGILYGVSASGVGPETIFFSSSWEPASWTQSAPIPGPNRYVFDSTADDKGRFFTLVSSARLSSGVTSLQDPRIFMLDTNAASGPAWTQLPDLPNGFLVDPTAFTSGGDKLYVAGKTTLNGPPVIFELSDPSLGTGASWSSLSTLPTATQVASDGTKSNPTLPFQLTDLQADREGSLYLQLQLENPSSSAPPIVTFARYQGGSWAYFPKPSNLSGTGHRGFLPMEIDDLGNVLTFGLPGASEPGAIYRFSESGPVVNEVVQGVWKELPKSDTPNPISENDLDSLEIDTEGNMFLGLRDPSASSKVIQTVVRHPLRGSQDASLQSVNVPAAARIRKLQAGGQGPTGQFQYVPVSWY